MRQTPPESGSAQSAADIKPPPGVALTLPTTNSRGEVFTPLPPRADPEDFTRTALKRAMRKRAQEYAEKAIARLAEAVDSEDERIAITASNDLLAWGFGKPATEIEVGEGGLAITILRFGDEPEAK